MPFVRTIALLGALIAIILIQSVDADAQRRVSYQQLKAQNQAPGLYLDHNIVQAEAEQDNVWFNFRFGNEVLNFRQQSGSSERFEARASLSIQIFKAGRETDPDKIRESNALKTLNWNGTTRTDSFDKTRSATEFLNGNVSVQLPPGRYAYSPTITIDGRSLPLSRNLRTFTIPDFNNNKELPIYFVESNEDIQTDQIKLVNYGRAVLYAEDFNALFVIPDTEKDYTVKIEQLRVSGRDTSSVNTVFDQKLDSSHLLHASGMQIRTDEADQPYIHLQENGEQQLTFANVRIPNREFQNASFNIGLYEGENRIASRHFRSLWIDIPTSLLNVDVAISMMQIILESDQFRELRRGNEQERVRKFRKFWKERDPEPETDYNPLMVEFFTRVDIAYDRFTTPNMLGYETDQGRIYIRHGEPKDVTRRLPSGSAAVEIWIYENREFVFEATSGFGEYRLRDSGSR